jgi:V/A-type H+-transporting ATPase subunit I
MNKITLLGMEYQREELTKTLMDLGIVDISEVNMDDYEDVAENPEVSDSLSRIASELIHISSSLDIINKYSPAKKPLFKSRRDVLVSDFYSILNNKEGIWDAVEKLHQYEEYLIKLKSEENKLSNLKQWLHPWGDLQVPLEIEGTNKTVFQYGTLPSTTKLDLVKSELFDKVPSSYIQHVNSDKEQHYVFFIVHNENQDECINHLKSFGFNRVTFPNLSGTVSDNIKRLEKEIEQIELEREKTIEQIKSMKDDRDSIEVLHDYLLMERDRLEATGKILTTNRVFLIKGWLPERNAADIKKLIESKFITSVNIEEPEDDEQFPVLIENKGIAETGEPVLKMYGLPNSREIDPNAIMAPFFIIFFGLMFSDGGYGLILALVAGFVLLKFELEEETRKFAKLLFYCGISTVFWGLMFGGWFGISALVPYAVWFDMVNQPELLLSWSLLFGVIHIFAGYGLKAANLIRDKKYLDAVFDVGFVLIFFTGAVLFLLPFVPSVNADAVVPLVDIGKYLLIIGGVLLILTQGRKSKNVISKFFGGVLSLYDVVGFLSDILSYSRLLALGLATSIIASIVNELSVMFDMPIVLKAIAAVVILLVGHTVNFAINALGAYVHSCRLQYLEFFGKFYTGGGEAFSPLEINTKYIKLKPDAELKKLPLQTA